MANQKTNKDILEIVSELPKDLRDAYFSRSTTEAINETGKKQGLSIDKIGELAHETGLVMIGITPPAEYIKNLTKRLDTTPEKAKAIAEEINQKVFQPVRESLKKIHGLETPPPTTQKPPPRQNALLRKEGEKETTLPPYEGGREEGLGVKETLKPPAPKPPPLEKRLPTKEEIKVTPPSLTPPFIPTGGVSPGAKEPPSIFVRPPVQKPPAAETEVKPFIPPIFEKHIPNENKSRDPYREPIE